MLALVALGACAAGKQAGPEPSTPPNIVYVLADDLGYGELGVYGQERIETPNIDALAHGGIRFTQHYSGSPVCAPSRGVVLTGLHTGRAYIRGNDEMGDRGDVWDFAKMAADPHDPASYARFRLKEYAPDLLLDEALQFVERNREQPFFLYFASPIPHLPLQAPERWVRHYEEKLGPEEPSVAERYFPNRTPRASYAAMISTLDEQVGLILEKLVELGLRDRTLVLFSSDNGPAWVDPSWGGADTVFFDSARPFRSERGRGKGSVHEGGIRVPMIASWPGHVAPGTSTDHISAFWDVLPTLGEIAGVGAPDDIDGLSFAPVLLGREGAQARHEFLYWEFPAYGGQQAVRLGRWKGIRRDMFDGNMEIELYDLESDLREESDVADEHPDVVARVEAIMEQEHTPSAIERFRFAVLGDGAGS